MFPVSLPCIKYDILYHVSRYGIVDSSVDPNFSIPDPESKGFRIPDPESKRFQILDPDPHQRIEVFLTQKIVSKLSEI